MHRYFYKLLLILCFMLSYNLNAKSKLDILRNYPIQEAEQSFLKKSLSTQESVSKRIEKFPHTFEVHESLTEAVLIFKNSNNNESIAFNCDFIEEAGIEIPALAWKELLQENTEISWAYGTLTEDGQIQLSENWQEIELDTQLLESIDLPQFNQKINGEIIETQNEDRKLSTIKKVFPYKRISKPGSIVEAISEEDYLYSYEYELTDGTLIDYIEPRSFRPSGATETVYIEGNSTFVILYMDDQEEGFFNSYNGDELRECLEWSIQKWADVLDSEIEIRVEVDMESLGDYILGQAGPLITMPPDEDFWFPSALANDIVGYDISPNSSDISMTFNSDSINEFFCSTDETESPPYGEYDFASITLHEMTHGLGFTDGLESTGEILDDTGLIFDKFIRYNNASIINLSNSERLVAITSEELYWEGPNAMDAYGDTPIPLYAPSSFEAGSSVSHWANEYEFDTFMKPTYSDNYKVIDTVLIAAMKDIGWTTLDPQTGYDIWIESFDLTSEEELRTASPANDGISNIIKYVTGLSPLEVNKTSDYLTLSMSASSMELYYKKSTSVEDVTITTQWSESIDAINWYSEDLELELIETVDELELWKATLEINSRRYMRLVFE